MSLDGSRSGQPRDAVTILILIHYIDLASYLHPLPCYCATRWRIDLDRIRVATRLTVARFARRTLGVGSRPSNRHGNGWAENTMSAPGRLAAALSHCICAHSPEMNPIFEPLLYLK
jgi:hypothetical protein